MTTTEYLAGRLVAEVDRQDRIHPGGYPADRDGLRLGLAALEDETREAYDEWRVHRRVAGWGGLAGELLQVAGVAMRMYRSVVEEDPR